MGQHRLLDYYRPAMAGDANIGGGYGTLKAKGLGSEYSRESTYPYRMSSYSDDDSFREDLEDFVDDELSADPDLIDRMSNKINRSIGTSDPVRGSTRADRSGFVTNQRMDLAPMGEMAMPPTRKGDSVYGTMSPIPIKSLYKGLGGGSAVGGASTSFAYTTGPGRKTGTQYGTSRAPLARDDDKIRVDRLQDIPDPAIRAIIKSRNNIQKVLSEVYF